MWRSGQPLPLIPRYFDLLVLLIDRRNTAVSRREIFDSVWADVVVSDGALSQAIRTLRRTLGDDSREPVFIRTVSRHGYSFVFPDVVEEDEIAERATGYTEGVRGNTDGVHGYTDGYTDGVHGDTQAVHGTGADVDALIARLMESGSDEEQRDAAERLHLLGTSTAIERLIAKPGHARALAILRDARWDVPGSGAVPLLRQPEGLRAAWALIRLRAARAFRIVEQRWASAATATAAAGAFAGIIGGSILVIAPTSRASATVIGVLAIVGALAGAIGASGIAAGITACEALARSRRSTAIIVGGAVGGLAVGSIAYAAVRWTLDGLFGVHIEVIGGPLEGIVFGAAAGIGYAATTRRPGGGGVAIATGRERGIVTMTVALCCVAAGLALASANRPLIGGLINAVASASRGSDIGLTPLGRLIGDPVFGAWTKAILAIVESGLFGLGLAIGLTRRVKG